MITKLRGMTTDVAWQSWIDVATAGEPVSLTDAQLDLVAGGFAIVALQATNASAIASFSLSDNPSMRIASITADFTVANGTTGSGSVSAEVGPND